MSAQNANHAQARSEMYMGPLKIHWMLTRLIKKLLVARKPKVHRRVYIRPSHPISCQFHLVRITKIYFWTSWHPCGAPSKVPLLVRSSVRVKAYVHNNAATVGFQLNLMLLSFTKTLRSFYSSFILDNLDEDTHILSCAHAHIPSLLAGSVTALLLGCRENKKFRSTRLTMFGTSDTGR
jgi:hypothetical protein